MGADGGVVWMWLRHPFREDGFLDRVQLQRNYDRVTELLAPFYQFTYIDDYHWSNVEWLNKPHGIAAPDYLIGTYGTDQSWDLGNLQEILREDIGSLYPEPDLTFLEMVWELQTRPTFYHRRGQEWGRLSELDVSGRFELLTLFGQDGSQLSILEALVWDTSKYWSQTEIERKLGILTSVTIRDWHTELFDLFDVKGVGLEQTWT